MAHTVQNVFTVTAGWTQTVSPRGYGHHCNRFHMHCEASEAKEALITTRQLSKQKDTGPLKMFENDPYAY